MQLILWRHAEAEDVNPKGDLARALTKHGRNQAARMAEWLNPRLVGDWRILVSPARRALETVEPLGRDYAVMNEIAPEASARSLLHAANWPHSAQDVVIVGHQPTLGEVASIIFVGEEGEAAVRKGSIWWFEARGREGRMNTLLKAVLSPDLLDPKEPR
ncbi:MAG TPA: histidine phosphatase family protein [Usitatibacter sp.]|nr:histidine phosphatase family protein [Usitatibacter sp.]